MVPTMAMLVESNNSIPIPAVTSEAENQQVTDGIE